MTNIEKWMAQYKTHLDHKWSGHIYTEEESNDYRRLMNCLGCQLCGSVGNICLTCYPSKFPGCIVCQKCFLGQT